MFPDPVQGAGNLSSHTQPEIISMGFAKVLVGAPVERVKRYAKALSWKERRRIEEMISLWKNSQ